MHVPAGVPMRGMPQKHAGSAEHIVKELRPKRPHCRGHSQGGAGRELGAGQPIAEQGGGEGTRPCELSFLYIDYSPLSPPIGRFEGL
jgi:hypothetical protein